MRLSLKQLNQRVHLVLHYIRVVELTQGGDNLEAINQKADREENADSTADNISRYINLGVNYSIRGSYRYINLLCDNCHYISDNDNSAAEIFEDLQREGNIRIFSFRGYYGGPLEYDKESNTITQGYT